MKLRFLSACLLLAGVSVIRADEASEQLPNLWEGNKIKPRFEVTDRTWPAEPGAAEICLWKDDKVAAVSISVDDNCAPDVPWWLEVSERYGFKVTWFLITRNVKKEGRGGFGGTWELWQSVLDKGHDIQSHTHTHLHVDEPDWQDIEWEYSESKRQIEENLPGHKVHFLAYPGGRNSGKNDRDVAARYYAGARAVTGAIPAANAVNYMGVICGMPRSLDDPKSRIANPRFILTPGKRAYRSWCVVLYHKIQDQSQDTPFLKFLESEKDSLWIGLFGEVSRYGQERDTATLNVVENSPQQISFDLTDRMDDDIFNFPLTIKVRLYDEWREVEATQAGEAVEVSMVGHEGARFALVQAVPDRGTVRLVPKAQTQKP